MPADELRARYVSMLLDGFSDCRYPSTPMMDRIESAIDTRDAAEDYVNRLLDTMEQDKYPSPTMLERVNRLIKTLASSEAEQ